MVLWEITLGTAYFLGLKRTYKLALRIQRKLISPKHPKIRQFVQRSYFLSASLIDYFFSPIDLSLLILFTFLFSVVNQYFRSHAAFVWGSVFHFRYIGWSLICSSFNWYWICGRMASVVGFCCPRDYLETTYIYGAWSICCSAITEEE